MKALEEVRFVAAAGSLGSGVDEAGLQQSLSISPHFIASDAGTTDAGPFSLGSGKPAFSREAVKRDLQVMLRASRKAGVPAIVGSAGTAGADVHVDWMMDIAREVIRENGWTLRVAVIKSEQSRDYLHGLRREGRIRALDPAPEFDDGLIDRSARIVGMMGVEPLQEALRAGCDLIIAGRCSDPALFAAYPLMFGMPAGLCWHAGKVAECGTLGCETAGKGVLAGYVRQTEAILRPFGAGLRCTPQSVAAHSLYENADPYLHTECSGVLDLTHASYEAVDAISVRIRGSAFRPADRYTVKLEGAELVGYQSILIGGVRDPFIIRQLDAWLGKIRTYIERSIAEVLAGQLSAGDYRLAFHVYGRNAVMGQLEPNPDHLPQEVGIVVEATAPTQALATGIAKLCRQPLLHAPIPEWKGAITGFACLHNPAEIERGAVYRFNLNHVAAPRDPADMHRTVFVTIGEKVECPA